MIKAFVVITDMELQILTSVLYTKEVSYYINVEEVNNVKYYLVYTPDVSSDEELEDIYKAFIIVRDMPKLINKM